MDARPGGRLRRQRRTREASRARCRSARLRCGFCWWSSAGRRPNGHRASSSSTATGERGGAGRCSGASLRGGREVGWTCTVENADAHADTPKHLYCYIFHRRCGHDERLPGNSAPLAELMPRMRRGGIAAVSELGVLGDPCGDRRRGRAHICRDGRRVCGSHHALGTGPRRDADMTGPRLPDGFAVQVDRRVKVLGEGSALLGGRRPGAAAGPRRTDHAQQGAGWRCTTR